MNNAARPRNETTRLSALATGLRFSTTAAPKTSISNEKHQNKIGDISQVPRFRVQGSGLKNNATMQVAARDCLNPEIRNVKPAYFLSFHLSTTPCITPPISSSLAL